MKSDLSFSDGLSDNSSNSTQRAVIPAQAGIQRFNVAAILKHSCNIRDWIPACAGMTAGGNRGLSNPTKPSDYLKCWFMS